MGRKGVSKRKPKKTRLLRMTRSKALPTRMRAKAGLRNQW